MANNTPTPNIKLFFLRGTRVRKDVIPGEAGALNDQDIMKIVPRGTRLTLRHQAAKDLIIGGSALEDNSANKDRISEIQPEIDAANKRDEQRLADKSQSKKQLQKAA